MASKKGNVRSTPRVSPAAAQVAPAAAPAAAAPAPVVAAAPVATPPAPPAPRQATKLVYTYGPVGKLPNPRTNGETGQNSNTQAAWQACYACLQANGGVATHDQLAAALQAVGLQFKTYVPYFANRTHWLSYATPAAAAPAVESAPAAPAAPAA